MRKIYPLFHEGFLVYEAKPKEIQEVEDNVGGEIVADHSNRMRDLAIYSLQ